VSEFYVPTFWNTLSFPSSSTTYGDGIEYSKTWAHKIQTLGNHPKERIQHSECGKSLKSRRKIPVISN